MGIRPPKTDLRLSERPPLHFEAKSRPRGACPGARGIQGGVGQFFIGLLMAIGGAYLLTSQVSVSLLAGGLGLVARSLKPYA